MKLNNNISKSVLAVMISLSLSACGGGGGSETPSSNTGGGIKPAPNQAPTLNVSPSALELESGQTATVSISANDDGGAPDITLVSASAGLSATIVDGGKALKIVAGDITASQSGSIAIAATEQAASKLQTSVTLNVDVHPKVTAYAYINDSEKVSALNVLYNKPLRFRLIDDTSYGFKITGLKFDGSSPFEAKHNGEFVELSALKTGSGELTISGTYPKTGQKFVKTFSVQAVGNQKPVLSVAPGALSMQELSAAKLSITITDPDGSAQLKGQMSAQSSDPSIATASIQGNELLVNSLKSGSATINVSVVDGEHTVSVPVLLTVTPEALPVLTINDNALMEVEENSTVTFPLSLTGSRADSYTITATATPEGFAGDNSGVLTASVDGRNLVLSAKSFVSQPAGGFQSFKVIASATDGTKGVVSFPVRVDVLIRSNGAPVFEMPNKFGKFVMLPKNGLSTVKITVNDDKPEFVKMSAPLPFYDQSKAGSYTATYNDATREITLDLSGYAANESFALFMPYQDGNMGGRFAVYFRTYEFSEVDKNLLEARKSAIATVEAAKAYTLIGKMYAEYLERSGLVGEQFVDEFVDQLIVDDRKWGSITNAEASIEQVLTQVYGGDFNGDGGANTAEIRKDELVRGARNAHTFSAAMITEINALAKKSNGVLPELSHESTFTEISPLQVSKFVGNTVYGKFENGVWVYHPTYKFLGAIDAKVFENTAARLK